MTKKKSSDVDGDDGLEALDVVKKHVAARKKAAKPAKPARSARSAKAAKPARTPKPARPRSSRRSTGPVTWRRWLAAEALTVGAGVVVGLAVTGGLLWSRATRDVHAWLADPPTRVPSVVWSAPVEVRPGMRASLRAVAGDLLAAGYERVDRVSEPDPIPAGGSNDRAGVFSVGDRGIDVWTAPWDGPTGSVPGGRATVRIEDGWVVETSDPDGVTFRPTVLGTIGDLEARRTPVDLDRLSKWMEPALLAMEDARFREHHGIDPVGIARALWANALGRDTQGGSTLTQQLAKNLFLSKERTLRRKVREVFFAAALESELDKDRILELYLSEVYLGQMGGLPIVGVEQAARAWFGVSAERLELHEAATLVGVIPAPNTWSPVRNPEGALERRNLVLAKMRSRGRVSEDQYQAAIARPLGLSGLEPSRVRRAPYAVDAAVDRAEQALGAGALAARGYAVHTGIQPLWQRAAEEAVAAGMAELDTDYPKAAGAQVALVAVRVDDGAVVALVGGRSYAKSPFDRAHGARRQAGSTVKPLTLLAALDARLVTPATKLEDQPISRRIDGVTWTPRNYDGTFLGEVTVRHAIEGSRNIPAIHLAEKVGATRLQRFYRDAGLERATHLPSAALGAFNVTPVELAGAYTAFADGVTRTPRVLLAIETADGEPVLEIPEDRRRLASPQAAAQALHILQGVLSSGTGARAKSYGVGPPAGGKTGTTDDYRDAWFVGLTPEIAVAVWVGRDEGTLGLSGSRAALPTWARFVAATGTLTGGEIRRPDGLVEVTLCAESGLPSRDACPLTYTDLFVDGEAPSDRCDLHGGPVVKAGRLFGNIFHKREALDPEQAEPVVE